MTHLTRLVTTGGPFCLSSLDNLPTWSGSEGDYWDLIELPVAEMMFPFVLHGQQYVAFASETGTADVFFRDGEHVIIEVEYLNSNEIDVPRLQEVVEKNRRSHLGDVTCGSSRMVMFDASEQGRSIENYLMAGEMIRRDYPFFIVLEAVDECFSIYSISHRDDTIAFKGVVLCRKVST